MAKAPTTAPPKAKTPRRRPPKRKPGQPKRGPLPWQPTQEQVAKIKLYAGLGSTQEQIAAMIGVCVDTMSKNPESRKAWEIGLADTIAKVAGSLVKKALGGDTASAIFYLKTQAGWKETVRSEHTGKDGGPIEYQNLSDEEIEARISALKAGDGPGITTH